jgi:hypothetical protein
MIHPVCSVVAHGIGSRNGFHDRFVLNALDFFLQHLDGIGYHLLRSLLSNEEITELAHIFSLVKKALHKQFSQM